MISISKYLCIVFGTNQMFPLMVDDSSGGGMQ